MWRPGTDRTGFMTRLRLLNQGTAPLPGTSENLISFLELIIINIFPIFILTFAVIL